MSAKLLQLYDCELRSNPAQQVGVRYEVAEGVLRARGHGNWIFARDLNPRRVDAVVSREVKYFKNVGEDVEWKVYGHEAYMGLSTQLAAHGFEPSPTETLMFLDLAGWQHSFAAPPGIHIRPVRDRAGVRDLVTVMSEAFGDVRPEMIEELQCTLFIANPMVFAYVAYADASPVAAGRMESTPGYAFASIWGGCTLPAFRHRGIFRALVATRVEAARQRGHSYLAVDAADTSRPILEGIGFIPATTVTGWNLRIEQAKQSDSGGA